jgi:hypothetical protein
MPFRTGMKIVVTNEIGLDPAMFYYDVNYTLGDDHGDNVMYFHAHWRRERPTTMKQDYEFLPKVMGKGRFLGLNCGVIVDTKTYFKSWWGEGECKIYLDGDNEYPTLCGTGTEDYIGTAWGQGQYSHLYQGCHLADVENFQYAFYRYHIPDPIYFYQDIRVTMHQIGCWLPGVIQQMRDADRELMSIDGTPVDMDKAAEENGFALFERQDDWSSCVYFYLNRATNDLPDLAPVDERTVGLLNLQDSSAMVDV